MKKEGIQLERDFRRGRAGKGHGEMMMQREIMWSKHMMYMYENVIINSITFYNDIC